ncbi:unnamed protein product [Leuciscus chuanchicus]
MNRSTFLELCNAIGPFVSPAASCPREPVSTNKRIAIAVYKLATCAEYRVVAETFGVSKTTVHRYPAKHPQETLEIEGVQVPLLLAGDPAYPLLPWVMKGFSGPNLTEAQTLFNEQLSTIRIKVEHTFGHLKTRWRVLAKTCDIDHDFMPTVVAACCILHNICEGEKQRLPPAALQVHPAPQQPQEHTQDEPDAPALEIRQALVNHLLRPH